MAWDPSGLELKSVTPSSMTNGEDTVTLTVEGLGFTAEPMFAVLVRSGSRTPARAGLIPCNDVKLRSKRKAAVRVCPKGKAPGTYDLVFWLTPPATVTNERGAKRKSPPVNDVVVLKGAIEVKKG